MTAARALALALAITVAIAVVAHAASRSPAPTSHSGYTIKGTTTVGALKVNYRAQALLPASLRRRSANGGPVLRFGPIGSCRFNLSVSARVVARSGDETAADRVARLRPAASSANIYAQGTRDSAAWRVVRLKGSPRVRGIYVNPANLQTTNAIDGPRVRAWLEVRGTANDHADECHSGGPRYVGASLAQAFGAMTGTAFSVDLPRLTPPPAPG